MYYIHFIPHTLWVTNSHIAHFRTDVGWLRNTSKLLWRRKNQVACIWKSCDLYEANKNLFFRWWFHNNDWVDCGWVLAIRPCMNASSFNKENSVKLAHGRICIALSRHITVKYGGNDCDVMISFSGQWEVFGLKNLLLMHYNYAMK